MTSKERFLCALDLGQPDKVPIHDFLFSPPLFEAVTGVRPKSYDSVQAVECAIKLGFDAVWIPVGGYAGYTPQNIGDNKYIDEWGTTYKTNGMSWPIDGPVDYPIKNREDYKNWTAPNPYDDERVAPLKNAIKYNENRIALLAGILGPFTTAAMLMGYEEMSVAFYEDPELVRDLLKEGAKFSLVCGKALIEAGADSLIMGDDLGYNSGLFISPEMMREYVLPVIDDMVTELQKAGGKVILHCDGNVNKIMSDIADTGMNAFHPMERKANMDIKYIKENYGKKMCLFGNVNTSTTLPFGSFEDIEEEVKECLRIAGPGGGYVIGSDHSISQGIPVENAFHFFETIQKYRDYPIKL